MYICLQTNQHSKNTAPPPKKKEILNEKMKELSPLVSCLCPTVLSYSS